MAMGLPWTMAQIRRMHEDHMRWERKHREDQERFRRNFPRAGEPWSVAEDLKLLRRLRAVRREFPKLTPKNHLRILTKEFGRTYSAIQGRFCILSQVADHLKVRCK